MAVANRMGSLLVLASFIFIGSMAHATLAERQAKLTEFENKGKECAVEKNIAKTDLSLLNKSEKKIMAKCMNGKGYSNKQLKSMTKQLQDMKTMQAFDTAVTACQGETGVTATSIRGMNKSDQNKMLGCLATKGYKNKKQVAKLAKKLESLKNQQAREAQDAFMKQCLADKGYNVVQTSRRYHKNTSSAEKTAYNECQEAAKNAAVVTAASATVDSDNANSPADLSLPVDNSSLVPNDKTSTGTK